MGALGGRLEGVLRALRTVKAARAEARETGRIALHAERSAEKSIRAVRLEAWAWTITGGGINLAVMLILGVGAYRVAAGDMTVTTLVAFLLYAFQLMMPVMLLTMSLTSVQSGLAAAARIGEINAMATESDEPAAAPAPATTAADAAPEATEDELWTALATVRLDQRVRELEHDLDTVLSPTTMSGGERQRVALARALVTDADLLLLDEATAQLDGLSEAAVAEGIRRQAATGAVVTIAHRLSTVIDADQIVLLEAGRVRAVGTHQQLLGADELYRELVAALRIATSEPEAVTTP